MGHGFSSDGRTSVASHIKTNGAPQCAETGKRLLRCHEAHVARLEPPWNYYALGDGKVRGDTANLHFGKF